MAQYLQRFAALTLVPAALVAGCASEPPLAQNAPAAGTTQASAAQETNPCTGVLPPTGSLIRRNADCGKAPAGRSAETQEIIDQIRAAPATWRAFSAPRPGTGG